MTMMVMMMMMMMMMDDDDSDDDDNRPLPLQTNRQLPIQDNTDNRHSTKRRHGEAPRAQHQQSKTTHTRTQLATYSCKLGRRKYKCTRQTDRSKCRLYARRVGRAHQQLTMPSIAVLLLQSKLETHSLAQTTNDTAAYQQSPPI